MLFVVGDGRNAAPASERTRAKWRLYTGCSSVFFLCVFGILLVLKVMRREDGDGVTERTCSVVACRGCGGRLDESCTRDDVSLLGSCRRRAQAYDITCSDCEGGNVQQACREFDNSVKNYIDLNSGEKVPAVGSSVPCYEVDAELTCSNRDKEQPFAELLAARVGPLGLPWGWAALTVAGSCFGLFVLSMTARWRHRDAGGDWQHQHGPGQVPQYSHDPSALGPAPMPTTMGVPVQGVPVQSQLVSITVPEGHPTGQPIQVQTPSGAIVTVVAPEGVGPGGTFQMQF